MIIYNSSHSKVDTRFHLEQRYSDLEVLGLKHMTPININGSSMFKTSVHCDGKVFHGIQLIWRTLHTFGNIYDVQFHWDMDLSSIKLASIW